VLRRCYRGQGLGARGQGLGAGGQEPGARGQEPGAGVTSDAGVGGL